MFNFTNYENFSTTLVPLSIMLLIVLYIITIMAAIGGFIEICKITKNEKIIPQNKYKEIDFYIRIKYVAGM